MKRIPQLSAALSEHFAVTSAMQSGAGPRPRATLPRRSHLIPQRKPRKDRIATTITTAPTSQTMLFMGSLHPECVGQRETVPKVHPSLFAIQGWRQGWPRSAFRERVVGFHQGAKALLQNLGVDLGGGDVGMAQQHLQAPQIGAVAEQMAGEGMAQHVRADPL